MSGPKGREEIRDQSSILDGKETSRAFLEGNREYFTEKYSGKEIVAVTSENGPEIAAAYEPESGDWRRALDQIEKTYSEEVFHTAVAREMK